jgi:hypothetical protein
MTLVLLPRLSRSCANHLAFNVNAVDVKTRFGDVETDCRDRLGNFGRSVRMSENSAFPPESRSDLNRCITGLVPPA